MPCVCATGTSSLADQANSPCRLRRHCAGVFEPGKRGSGVEQKRFNVTESFVNRRQHFLYLLDPRDVCIKANAPRNDPSAIEPAAANFGYQIDCQGSQISDSGGG